MAAVGNTNPTLLDVASRSEGGKIAKTIIELLAETNEIIQDATAIEGNDGEGHKTTIRSGLPTATWRQLNYGVQPSKSKTVQVRDACGMLEAYAEVDKALADLNGNTAEFRLSEDSAFLEAMNQGFVDAFFYGNTTINPERFMGLAPRYNSLSAENGGNIVSGLGNANTNTSIWLKVWGPNTSHLIYPKGSKAGIQHTDKGQVTKENAGGVTGALMEMYRSHYKWDVGYTLRDWRYVARGANIDVEDLTPDATGGSANVINIMVQMIGKIPNLSRGRPVFYCNRDIHTFLLLQLINKGNAHVTMQEIVKGQPMVLHFMGIPVRRCDAILNTEATVS
jgi:hypothetical protein